VDEKRVVGKDEDQNSFNFRGHSLVFEVVIGRSSVLGCVVPCALDLIQQNAGAQEDQSQQG
jgi:hypothetical protein